MGRVRQFALPDLGEGLTEGEILDWKVAVGDEVKVNQPLVEVETAKAAVEVPSPWAGVVTKIHHDAGETVDVGAPIVSIDTDPGAGPVEDDSATAPAPREAAEDAADAADAKDGGRQANLVGYGVRTATAKRRPRKDGKDAGPTRAPDQTRPETAARVSAAAVGDRAAQRAEAPSVLAKPPVRKLAKDLGVDLASVAASGPNGTVTREDVERAAQGGPAQRVARTGEREQRIPIKGVRKATAEAMVASAFTAPHVTEFVTLDMTPTMDLRARVAALPEFAGVKVTPLLFVAKALLLAVKRHPEINASWDEAAQEIVVKNYVNLGIAAATPRGLVVPNVKDADALSLPDLARALQDLTETAKAGKTAPGDMQGGTITITNVGVFGVDTGTPILNPGESAILAFGAVRAMPWVVDGAIVPRQVTQLALSFDHRLVDGQLGSEVLADVARVLSDPATALVWG